MASSTPPSHASMLTAITTDLDKLAPRFEIDPDQITIIQTPAEFYETLKVGPDLSLHHLSLLLYFCSTLCQSSIASSSTMHAHNSMPFLFSQVHAIPWIAFFLFKNTLHSAGHRDSP
jgi:hypothetical protein